MHKACTQRELQKRKANETKNSPTDGEEVNPKPETNQTAPHKRSQKVYLKQSLCSQNSGCFVLSKLSTSSKKESNSTLLKTSSQTNSASQIVNPKLNSEAPKPPKWAEHQTPQQLGCPTMNEQMIHGFIIRFTHTTPPGQHKTLFP